MATTTNYGWTTPDDTALVKDGASAIRTLGSSADTTVKALSPGTTAGDLDYYTSATTKARIAIGTSGQVLKVTGGVPVWGAGASGQLTETVFTSSNATYTIPTGVTGIWALCVGSGGGGGASSTATASNSAGGGGAGQAIEKFIAISGDTTLNITVPAGGAGGTAGGQGSSGSVATIVGNQSATTYLSAAGGGGGGGGAAANVAGLNGASGGGAGVSSSATTSGGGGGMAHSGSSATNGIFNQIPTTMSGATNGTATTVGVTGYGGGTSGAVVGGTGINIFGRSICAGGYGGSGNTGTPVNFGAGAPSAVDAATTNATANKGSGGNGGRTSLSAAIAGSAGGSGLVVLRYVV